MLGLTNFGIVHTLIGLVALVAGMLCFVRDGKIGRETAAGRLYVLTPFLTAISALAIFQHGGFGKAHALALLTLLALLVAGAAEITGIFGRASRAVATVGYTTTFLFHMIPAVTEASTRLPLGHPNFANADAPGLQKITLAMVVIYMIAAVWQVRSLKYKQYSAELTAALRQL